jgi:hypothetical protein
MSSSRDVLVDAGRAPGERVTEEPGRDQPGDSPGRRGLRAAGLFLAADALLMLLVGLWQPRFFYIDDMQAQYLPVWRWLGDRTGLGGPPLIDPDQGSGGAFVADLQYGVLDPVHWVLTALVAQIDDLNLAAWGLKTLVVVVLGLGTTVLATHLGARPVWAAAAAVGAANGGFLLWFGSSWWPSGWGTAWLPWLWWALSSRSRWSVPAAAAAAYLLMTSGYPYVLPFAGVVVVGVLAEHVLRAGRGAGVRALLDRPLLARLGAGAGGALLGAPGLLTASVLTPLSQRSQADPDSFGNPGTFVPNFLDVLLGGPTTSPAVAGWWGQILPPPVMATAWFVLPVLALVRWGHRPDGEAPWRGRGIATAGLLTLAALAATQTPTIVADLRFPFRYVVVVQLVLPLLVAVLASRCGVSTAPRRLALAGGLLLVQAAVSVSRSPSLWRWHLLAALVGLAALATLALLGRRIPPREKGAPLRARNAAALALVALVLTAAAPLVSIRAAVSYQAVGALAVGEEPTGLPARAVYESELWPSTAAEFRAASQGVGLNATVVWWGGAGADRGALVGVPIGSAGLLAGIRAGYGYTSLGQAGWADRWCADFIGQLTACPAPEERLLETVPGTDVSWLLALSKDVVLLDDRAPDRVLEEFGRQYRLVGEDRGFLRFERVDPTPGRITWVSEAVTSVEALEVAEETESYQVEWSGDGGRVFARIPWWPGYTATLDGQPVPIEVVDGTAVAVALPSGEGSGTLEIRYERPRQTAGRAAVVLGALVTVAALGLGLAPRRRSRTD